MIVLTMKNKEALLLNREAADDVSLIWLYDIFLMELWLGITQSKLHYKAVVIVSQVRASVLQNSHKEIQSCQSMEMDRCRRD